MPALIHCHIKGQYFIAFTTFTFLPLPLLPYTEAYMLHLSVSITPAAKTKDHLHLFRADSFLHR